LGSEKLWKDPIVEEVREARAKLAKECDYDIHKMALRFRKTTRKKKV